MKAYSLEIEIDVPRDKATELFGDPDAIGKWQPGFQSIEELPAEDGTSQKRYRLRYSHGKREIEMIETVEVDALPDEFTASYDAPGVFMRVKNRFEEIGADKTRWISENEATTSGMMMKLMALLMPGCFKKQSFKYMENFKALAEDGTDIRDS